MLSRLLVVDDRQWLRSMRGPLEVLINVGTIEASYDPGEATPRVTGRCGHCPTWWLCTNGELLYLSRPRERKKETGSLLLARAELSSYRYRPCIMCVNMSMLGMVSTHHNRIRSDSLEGKGVSHRSWCFPRPMIYFEVFRHDSLEKLPGLNRAPLWHPIAFFERKSNKALGTNEDLAGCVSRSSLA